MTKHDFTGNFQVSVHIDEDGECFFVVSYQNGNKANHTIACRQEVSYIRQVLIAICEEHLGQLKGRFPALNKVNFGYRYMAKGRSELMAKDDYASNLLDKLAQLPEFVALNVEIINNWGQL